VWFPACLAVSVGMVPNSPRCFCCGYQEGNFKVTCNILSISLKYEMACDFLGHSADLQMRCITNSVHGDPRKAKA
jgi:hypothetical protein